ncbi:MAG: alpha-glucosidase/alpha-galactosidase [Chloroflexi bacterium HGW-Chloroflexi-10]|nr:MAG: alpha-glucosidase/alpha-galactosidase [Chloroflexi bacterium HGW-Chloroflexi-10]
MNPISLKIAYVGGGSRDWARKLMIDLALCPDLTGEVALYDIDMDSARLNEQLGNWIHASHQEGILSHWRYFAVPTLRDALQNADFVIISVQPGPLELMAKEIALAEEYGLFFPVGDTVGASGMIRGLRSVTIYKEFAEAIAAICPKAWVINYTNPMTICTRTLTRVAPELKVFGCCHEVFGTQAMLAKIAGQYLGIEPPSRNEIQVNVLGINHFTWVDRATYQGHDLLALLKHHLEQPGVMRAYTQEEVESWNDWFKSAEQVKFALLHRFGILAAAGDRHLVEFLPGFIRSPETLFRWGVIRTPVSWRIERWRNAPQKTRDLINNVTPFVLERSGEEGANMIMALLGQGDLVTNVNIENVGQIANAPLHAVVETNAYFSRDNIRPLSAGTLPAGLAPLINQHIANQELIIEAALTKNMDLAFQAFFNDPANDLPLDTSWEFFNRMLQLNQG